MKSVSAPGRNKKQSGLDEDGMVRPAEKVEDGYCLANKILDMPKGCHQKCRQAAKQFLLDWENTDVSLHDACFQNHLD